MKKNLFILGMMVSSIYYAQNTGSTQNTTTTNTGRVGINNTAPTEALDVEGNGRVRALANGENTVDFPKVVVAKADGTLGQRNWGAAISKAPVVNIPNHPATGLKWNTNNNKAKGGTAPADRSKDAQDNYANYILFGAYNDVSASSGGWTDGNTSFTANAGEFLTIQSIINFEVQKNGATSDADKNIDDISVNGDRQVIIYMYLYKGNTMLKKVKQIVNFRGRVYNNLNPTPATSETANIGTDKGYASDFSQLISMNYLVPEGGDANNYSVSVVVTARAPYDGNFRLNLQDRGQQLIVIK